MIQSVQRALDILSCFSLSHPTLGIGEISDLVGLPRTTVHGLVRTLVHNGFLRQEQETRRYGLGSKIFELGAILGNTLEINRRAAEPLYELARKTRLEARIAIWEMGSVLLTMGASLRAQAFYALIGPRMPAYCSASGRVFLAYLEPKELEEYLARTTFTRFTSATVVDRASLLREIEKTRKRGYARNREELRSGVVALAAPIFERTGQVAAAISLSMSPDRFEEKKEKALVQELLRSAMIISREMGFAPESFETGKRPDCGGCGSDVSHEPIFLKRARPAKKQK
jgi:DNA-binding IclR family transcriptional regulator